MLVASDGLVGERIVGIVVSCNSASKSYGEATDEKCFYLLQVVINIHIPPCWFYSMHWGWLLNFCVLVYCRFDLSWSRWTSTVEMEGGKQLIILLMSSPGHKINFPLSLLGGNFFGIYWNYSHVCTRLIKFWSCILWWWYGLYCKEIFWLECIISSFDYWAVLLE